MGITWPISVCAYLVMLLMLSGTMQPSHAAPKAPSAGASCSLHISGSDIKASCARGSAALDQSKCRNSSSCLFSICSSSKATVDVRVTDAGGSSAAVLCVGGNADVTFRGAQFLRNSGTVLKVQDRARVALTEGTRFERNTRGPALVVTGGAMVTALGATFNNNSAERASGGAISVSGSASFNLINSSMTNNRAPDTAADAGAMIITGAASVTGTACEFIGNQAEYNAGAISVGESSRLQVTSCTFAKGNATIYAGGGIYAIGNASVAVSDTRFLAGSVGCSGGGISAGGHTRVNVSNCTFEDNTASYGLGGGGVVAIEDARMIITGSKFRNNTSVGSSGGGLAARDRSMVNVTDTKFTSNIAEVDGGAIYIIGDATVAVDGGVMFNNNTAQYAGTEIRASVDMSLVLGDANIDSTSPAISWSRKICEVGEIKSGPGGTCVPCPVNTYSLDNSSATCRPCPERGAMCAGGALIYPAPGFWHSSPLSTQFHKCPTPAACLGGRSAEGHCAEGHEGNLCMSCSKGYATSFSSAKCRKCDVRGKVIATYLGAVIVLVFLAWLSLHFALREIVAADNQSHSSHFVKLLIRHAQFLLIVGSLKVSWPDSLHAAFALVNWVWSLGGPQVASLDCLLAVTKPLHMPLAVKRILINLFAPLGVAVVVALLWFLVVIVCAGFGKPVSYHAHFSSLRRVWPVCALVCLTLFLPWLVRIGLGFFACVPIDAPNSQYASATAKQGYFASSIEQACYTGWHRKYALSLGVLTFLMFCVGIPAGLWALLFLQHRRPKKDAHEPCRLLFLYRAYRPQHYYWEVVTTLQIIAGMAISVFSLSLGSYYSLLLLNTAFVLFGSMGLLFKPYLCPTVQRFSLASFAVLYFTTQLSLTLFSNGGVTAPDMYMNVAGALAMLANLTFMFTCLAYMLSHNPGILKLWARALACCGLTMVNKPGGAGGVGSEGKFGQVAEQLPAEHAHYTGPRESPAYRV